MANLNTLSQYREYFKTLAAAHKQIGHVDSDPKFFGTADEFIEASWKGKGIAMVLGWSRTRIMDRKSDNILKNVESEIWLITPVDVKDHEAINKAYEDTEQIAIDILSYLLDKVSETPPGTRPFKNFQPDGTIFEPIGPIGVNNCFGTMFRVIMGNPEFLEHDETKWNF